VGVGKRGGRGRLGKEVTTLSYSKKKTKELKEERKKNLSTISATLVRGEITTERGKERESAQKEKVNKRDNEEGDGIVIEKQLLQHVNIQGKRRWRQKKPKKRGTKGRKKGEGGREGVAITGVLSSNPPGPARAYSEQRRGQGRILSARGEKGIQKEESQRKRSLQLRERLEIRFSNNHWARKRGRY